MATKTVSTGWSDGNSNFGSLFSDSGGDKYYSMPISTVNTAIKNAGIPANAVISGVSLTATATIENSMAGRFYLSIGFGGSGSISTTLLNGAQIAYNEMSGSTTQTVSLNAALSNNSINTSKGSYITFRIYSTTWGKKTYKVKDVNLTITYSIPTYTLTVNAGTGGTVTGGGTYNNQATATLTATPNTGYKFVKWSDGNTSATRTVTVTGNATYTAYFESSLPIRICFRDGSLENCTGVYVNKNTKTIYFKNDTTNIDNVSGIDVDTVDDWNIKVDSKLAAIFEEAATKEVIAIYINGKKIY